MCPALCSVLQIRYLVLITATHRVGVTSPVRGRKYDLERIPEVMVIVEPEFECTSV